MKTFLTVLKTFLHHLLLCTLLIKILILYTSIVLAIIYFFKIYDAIALIGFLKLCFPSIFVIPSIIMTLLNNNIYIIVLKKIKQYNFINYQFILPSNIAATFIMTLIISLPTFVYDFYLFSTNFLSTNELIFEFVKFSNLLLFFVMIAFLVKIETNNKNDVILCVLGLNIFLTFGLFVIDLLLSDLIFSNYFGGYFGTHIFLKLSLAGLELRKNDSASLIDNNPLVSGITNDTLLTIILALISLITFLFLMFYSNKKFIQNYQTDLN